MEQLNLTLTLNKNGSIKSTWTAVSKAVRYQLYMLTPGQSVLYFNELNLVKTSYTSMAGLPDNQQYQVVLIAFDNEGMSIVSEGKKLLIPLGFYNGVPIPAPGNIKAVPAPTSVRISWDKVLRASGYDILFNGMRYQTTSTFIEFTKLTPKKNYVYRVRGKNAGEVGVYSAEKTVTTLPQAPAVPSNIRIAATDNSVTISWTPVERATGYDVQFNGAVYGVTGVTKTFTGLTPNVGYTCAVRSKNEDGASAYSAVCTVTTPSLPSNINVTGTENAIVLSWGAVPGATSYDIIFHGNTVNVKGTSYTFTGLTPNTGYTYQIRTNNANGSSSYSTGKTVKTAPAPPRGASVATNAKKGTITLSWGAVPGADSYDILFNGVVCHVTGTSHTFTGLAPGKEYSYQIRSNSKDGSSSYSPVNTVKTLLDAPEGVRAEAAIDSILISFEAAAGATGYDINFNGEVYRIAGTSRAFTGLISDEVYTYAVRSVNGTVTSEYTKEAAVRTLPDLPEVPDPNAVSTLDEVEISWEPVAKATTGYDIKFDGKVYTVNSEGKLFFEPGTDARKATELSKTFTGLKPGKSYSYSMRARNGRFLSAYSPTKHISTKKRRPGGLPNESPKKHYPDGKIPYMGLDPVNALTGDFLWSYTCLEDYGKERLHFTVMYDSHRHPYFKTLGIKWTYSLNYRLHIDSEFAYFGTPHEELIVFVADAENDSYMPLAKIHAGYTMEKNQDGSYRICAADGMEYMFDSRLCLTEIAENGLTVYRFEKDAGGQITRIEGQYGAAVVLEYAEEHLTRVTDAVGNAVSFEYAGDCLAAIVNPGGNRMSFTYDADCNLLTITDFSGENHVTNRYDAKGRVVAQQTAFGGSTTASYDEEKRSTVFTDEMGNATKYFYDENYQVTSVEFAGSRTQNQYNEKGQLIKQIDELGNATRMEYDACGRVNHVIYPDGTAERIHYNDGNYPLKMVNRDGTESSYLYDERNNLVSSTEERGKVCAYAYDSFDNLISYTDKNGHVWRYTYDAKHHLEQAQDPDGNIYKYRHDAIGRLLSYTSPNGNKISYQYSAEGDLLRIVDADGTVAFSYNENGNRTGVTDRRGNRQRLAYNRAGQISMATDFMGNEYHFAYDQRGNLITETDPLGYCERYTYDAMGNNTGRTDKNGGTTSYSFNAKGQMTEVRDAAGGIIQYAYDTMGQVISVTDPLDNQTGCTYDAMGRVTSVTNALGYQVCYTYDAAGNILTKTDENGTVIRYVYDNEGRLLRETSDLGTLVFTYDKLGRVTAVQDVDGYSETASYDPDGNVTEVSDKENNRTRYRYDASGRLAEETDAKGNKTCYEYDANGNCVKITDANENAYVYKYDANDRLTQITDPLGYKTVYAYDAVGNLVSVTDALQRTVQFAYDGNGNRIREVNPDGGVRTYVYDSVNRLTEAEDEEGHKRSFTYDANGNMRSYTDANQNRWEYEYDGINRMTRITDQTGGHMEYEYTKTGQIAVVTDSEGAKTSYRYDAMGRLTEMSDVLGHSLSFTYDSLGKVTAQKDACGNVTEYAYSPNGKLLRVTDGEGNITAYTYDKAGQMTAKTDGEGNVTSYSYDALGQVLSITDAMGGKTSFTYTAGGQIDSVTDANGAVTRYRYGACGNLTQVTDPLGCTVAFEYDAMNNQIRECLATADAPSCVTLYQYDKKGRIVREINPLQDEKVYTYDGNDNIVSIVDEDAHKTTIRYDLNSQPVSVSYSDGREAAFRYNKRGELVELRDWNGTTAMEYDRIGQMAKVTDHNGREIRYRYDGNGNVTGIVYPDSSTVGYTYDKNNRMKTVVDAEAQETKYTYDAAGNLLSVQQPGSRTVCSYNSAGLPVQVRHQLTDGTYLESSYGYDAVGNIISETAKGSSSALARDAAYTYDAAGRLIGCRSENHTESYGYDALGNRIWKNVNGAGKCVYRYNAWNQLTARTEDGISYGYSYDRRGNLTRESRGESTVREYHYDAAGHMVLGRNRESRRRTEYTYNGLGMRVKNKQMSGALSSGYLSHAGSTSRTGLNPFEMRETDYVIDFLSGADNELMAYEKDYGAMRVTYGRGYERLSQKLTLSPDAPVNARSVMAGSGNGKCSFCSDISGSPVFAVGGQGGALRYAKRDVWGDLSVPVYDDLNCVGAESGMLFTTYSHDGVLDHYFAKARFYDAGQGRMLAVDPVRRGLNGYPYCKNNPVNYVDPTGEIAHVLAGGILGGIAGGIFGFAGSAISQAGSGRPFSVRNALGSAANAAVTGAARGALISSGAGLAVSLAANFGAGAAGSAAQQWIGRGKVNFGESVTNGLINSVSGAIYGNAPLNSLKSAFVRGAASGAASAGISSLSRAWEKQSKAYERRGRIVRGGHAGKMRMDSYTGRRDPKGGCGAPSPFSGRLSYGNANGYRFRSSEKRKIKSGGFSFVDFTKDIVLGAVMGGLASAGFYGMDRTLGAVKSSIGSARSGNKGGSASINRPSTKTQINSLPETKAPNAIKASEVTNSWDNYLGSDTMNIHPITGKPDPNRIFSSDATKSIRFGNHEMNSVGTTKAHFHYEAWDYNATDDIMSISNILQRFRD